jgi:hypothetical protein
MDNGTMSCVTRCPSFANSIGISGRSNSLSEPSTIPISRIGPPDRFFRIFGQTSENITRPARASHITPTGSIHPSSALPFVNHILSIAPGLILMHGHERCAYHHQHWRSDSRGMLTGDTNRHMRSLPFRDFYSSLSRHISRIQCSN